MNIIISKEHENGRRVRGFHIGGLPTRLRLKGLINTIPAILNDIKEYKVRNCAELVSWSDSDLGKGNNLGCEL